MWNIYSFVALGCGVLIGLIVWTVTSRTARARRSGATPVPTVGVVNLLIGGVVAGAASIIVAFALVMAGAAMFMVFHTFWFVLIAGLPLAAAGLLTGPARLRRRPAPEQRPLLRPLPRPTAVTRPATVLLTLTVAIAGIGVYASVIEPDRLDIERMTVPLDPARGGDTTLRIGVLSDIQSRYVGAHELRAIDMMMAEQPDIILIAGDVYQGPAYEAHQDELRSMLGRMHAPGGVYLVQGDSDAPWTTPLLVEGTDVAYLDNRSVQVRVGDRDVTIGGIDVAYNSDEASGVGRALEAAPGEGDVRLLLSHRPDAVYGLRPHSRVDLVVAGHTHGGQINIPWFGPLLTLSGVPRDVAAGGLHTLDGRRIYVSKGVGLERNQAPQVRFNVVPNIGIIELG